MHCRSFQKSRNAIYGGWEFWGKLARYGKPDAKKKNYINCGRKSKYVILKLLRYLYKITEDLIENRRTMCKLMLIMRLHFGRYTTKHPACLYSCIQINVAPRMCAPEFAQSYRSWRCRRFSSSFPPPFFHHKINMRTLSLHLKFESIKNDYFSQNLRRSSVNPASTQNVWH